ncbi:MAG: GDYXXLXY domain-containing protein [Bacillota bacterium]
MSRKFWAAVALQILILLLIIALHSFTLLTGRPVLLKTAPIDPWDPFRGEYVRLTYEISRLETTLPMTGWPYESGQRVWVTLRRGDPFWSAVAVSDRRPGTGPDEVAVRGRILWTELPGEGRPGHINLRYGIEQFYVPEGQGRELEGKVVEMTIEAMVDSTGRAALRTVYLEGKPIEWR